MKEKKKICKFNPIYWPWIIDLLISIITLLIMAYFIYIFIIDQNLFSLIETSVSVFTIIYSFSNFLIKRKEDLIQKNIFENQANHLFEDCRKIIETHLPESLEVFDLVEEKVIQTYFDEWKKYKNIKTFEYKILESYLYIVQEKLALVDEDRIFLKYVLITSSFSSYYQRLVSELKDADFFSYGSEYNIFIRKLHNFIQSEEPLNKIELKDLSDDEIQSTLEIALNGNQSLIQELLKDKKKRDKVDYLLNKCFENAYTNIGDLDLIKKDDESRKLIFLYKYDERFSILKRKLNSAIKDYCNENYAEEENKKEIIEEEKKRLEKIIYPLPLSKALKDYSYCIEQLTSNEKFAHIVYPENFEGDAIGWSTDKFMSEKVVPSAANYLKIFNKKLIKEFPYLKKYQKRNLDINYYIFEFNRKNFIYHASEEAIPIPIKKFLIRNILESQDAGDVVASQLVYLKQVINKLSISGLLFTENNDIQKKVREFEKEFIRKIKSDGIHINNIYEITSIGNQKDELIKNFHNYFHGIELKRKYGKKYDESVRLIDTMISNAKELIDIFDSFKNQS